MTKPIIYYSAYRLTHGYTDVGGWADRLKGILFCKILARVWDGELKIIWPSKAPLPLELKRTEVINFLPDSPYGHRYDLIDFKKSKQPNILNDLIALKPTSGEFYINVNSMHFSSLGPYKEKLVRLFHLRKWTEGHLFEAVYKTLFQNKVRLLSTNEFAEFVKFRDLKKCLIGAHIRCGGWGAWADPILDLPRNGSVLAKAVKCYAKYKGIKNYQVYLASDNLDAKNFFLREFCNDREIFTQQGVPVHVDRSDEFNSKQFENVFVDHYCLSLCDAVMHGVGDFAVTAAMTNSAEYLRYETYSSVPFANRLLLYWYRNRK